jgi:hypothetical protein
VRAAPDHHGGTHALRRADVAAPAREPVEALERRAVGDLFERAPLVLERVDVA